MGNEDEKLFVAVATVLALTAIAYLVYLDMNYTTKCEAAGGTEVHGRCLIVKEIKP